MNSVRSVPAKADGGRLGAAGRFSSVTPGDAIRSVRPSPFRSDSVQLMVRCLIGMLGSRLPHSVATDPSTNVVGVSRVPAPSPGRIVMLSHNGVRMRVVEDEAVAGRDIQLAVAVEVSGDDRHRAEDAGLVTHGV